jgi:hypothetical protein
VEPSNLLRTQSIWGDPLFSIVEEVEVMAVRVSSGVKWRAVPPATWLSSVRCEPMRVKMRR